VSEPVPPPAGDPHGPIGPGPGPGPGPDGPRRRGEPVRGLLRRHAGEELRAIGGLGREIALGAVVGVLAGLSSAAFLATLNWATQTRETHPWLLGLLPGAGLATGAAYHYLGGRAARGNNVILDEIHEPTAWVPRRMAPLIYAGSVATHLFGGSAGREGSALQMAGSLTDGFSRLTRQSPDDRRVLLIAALSGGFGACFGVPIAGCVFGLEVQSVGRVRYDAIVPALTASVIGDQIVRGLGVHGTRPPPLGPVDLDPGLVLKVLLAAVVFGLISVAFTRATDATRRLLAARPLWPPLRPFLGGVAVIGLTLAVGTRDYLGLSLPLAERALTGGEVLTLAFGFKLLFTVVTLGSGFQGGEVTPLFVIGATLGATLGHVLGVPVPLMAALGFVAVFGAAANVPLTCTIMGVELFGPGPLVLFAVTCVVAYVCSSHRGIYPSQRPARRDPD
jgi:H+/Cl- antiporter ClcA